MFDRPACRFRRAGFVLGPKCLDRGIGTGIGVENTGHDVEAAVAGSPGFDRVRGQPGMRTAPQSTLLAFVDRLRCMAMSAGAPTLDLDENEQSPATRDQVDLDAICSDVARDDAISSGLEESGGSSFALASEPLTGLMGLMGLKVVRRASTHSSALMGRTG